MDELFEDYGLSIQQLISWVSVLFMIVGGVIPYIPQYREIRRSDDAEGFSLHVCLALLVANTLRIIFWFGKQYETPLLIQSIVMIITMFVMIDLCTYVRGKMVIKPRDKHFTDFQWENFWQWTDTSSYIQCIIVFAVLVAFVTFILSEIPLYIELLGLVALLTEACLGTPQLLKNQKNRSTEGMSVKMVIMWTCGDIFKTIYFIMREAPFQFWACGILQITIDLLILTQVYIYKGHRPRRASIAD